MRRDDLMKPDLLSELVLMASGLALLVLLATVVIATFAPAGLLW